MERADHRQDSRIVGKELNVLRALRRVMDALADIVVGDGLQIETGIRVAGRAAHPPGLLEGEIDGVLRRQPIRRIVAAERQVHPELDDADGVRGCADAHGAPGNQQHAQHQGGESGAAHRAVARWGSMRRTWSEMSVTQSEPKP